MWTPICEAFRGHVRLRGVCLLYYTRHQRNYNEIVENLLADPSNFPVGYDIINYPALGPDREREWTQ